MPARLRAVQISATAVHRGKTRTWMPWRPNFSTMLIASEWRARRNSGVPPSTVKPAASSMASSRCRSDSRRAVVAASQCASPSAALPIRERGARNSPGSELGADAACERGFRNRKAEPQSCQSVGFAEGPQNDRAGGRSEAMLAASGSTSIKASSTMSSPFLFASVAATARSAFAGMIRPVGLFGIDDDDNIGAVALRRDHSPAKRDVLVASSRPRAPRRSAQESQRQTLARGGEEAGSRPACPKRQRSFRNWQRDTSSRLRPATPPPRSASAAATRFPSAARE